MRRLLRAGVNVCLGSDSLASVFKTWRETVELNMFEEMRTFSNQNPWLSSKMILRMATMNGARALGMEGQIGELTPKSFADLVAIPYSGRLSGVHEGALEHKGDVTMSMIDGQWARGAHAGQVEVGV
jgi:cytosine/adenosine deaminase-related metal-dependent hydrolase